MWWGSEESGGEGSKEPPPPPNQEDMKERYEQQQLLLAQLKEMLRKSEQSSSVSREKVEEYASTLSEINARAKLSKIKRSEGRKNEPEDPNKTTTTTTSSSSKKSSVVTPAKEKINLLQQQLAENRAKLAQRDKNQKDIEEMFNQLKAQLDSEVPEEAPTTPLPLSAESSKEDLLNAIKCKDDHIIELTTKMEQLHANVLDLQENIKEKDSVIDARTKAITLLSENLSKKGKNTLDMLDETKEQMRHMQENFVQIESDMKEELLKKNKLMDEFKSANIELEQRLINLTTELFESENKVKELTKLNEELEGKLLQSPVESSEPSTPQKTAGKRGKGKNKKLNTSENSDRIAELEKEIEDKEKDKEEVAKLTKQLEEMNKNMIKMKAQHKSKLKEMQKKSSPIDQDQADKVAILEQRLAEVEEDKGNLQLRLVDLESNNSNTKEKEYIADLENKIEDQKLEIESHICTITTMESQITASCNEISSLRSELSDLMHLENAQVCSEMTSVQLEEQLDKEMSQKKQIQDKYNEIIKENEQLQERIEALNKEKQELSAKLDNYMQENIELIDRLEKLSAEKVSSAESIEIVESLTQQEKLEIEAYQKNMEQPLEEEGESSEMINETKLTEETSPSELLERIELFTIERREVMDKMDRLHVENQQLLTKCEKLDEKHDKLSIEKDSCISKIDQLSAENHDLQEKLKNFEANDNEKLQEELTEYRALLENQKLQIASLQEELWNKPEENTKQHETIEQLRAKISENEEEISFLQSNVEDNKIELIAAAGKIAEYNKTITMKCTEIDILKNETDELQQTIMDLNSELENRETSKQEEINMYSNQLAEFKNILAEHIDQLEKYENESKQNSSTIEDLNDQIEELNYKITEIQHENQLKNAQIIAFASEKADYQNKIKHLETELKKKNEDFAESCRKLKEKCAFLENQIQTNTGSIEDIKIPFENKIKELETKNREQVEKMKKIAANLKKKSTICQELEAKLAGNQEKWERETSEKQQIINEQQIKLEESTVKINSLLHQIKDVEMQINELTKEKDETEMRLRDLQDQVTDKDKQIDNARNEISMIKSEAALSSKEIIQSLSTQLEELKLRMETAQNAVEAKLQEKDMFIEHLETESNKFREKVIKLEEGLSSIIERRQILEEHALDLKVQLEEKSSAYEEAFQIEDILEKRLTDLMEHDEVIEQKLKQSLFDNQSLNNKLKTTIEDNERLNHKIMDLHSILEETSTIKEKLEHYENECTRLTTHITNIENDKKKLQNDYERQLNDKNIEIENMEVELNNQLQELHAERKNILNRCEVLQDNIKEYVDNEQLINNEITQLQEKIILTNEELELKRQENLQLTKSISDLLLKIEQLELTLQAAPTSGNDLLLPELEQLQKVITEKDLEIQYYQQQNMQLQMATPQNVTGGSIFDSIDVDLKTSLEESNTRCNEYQQQLKHLTDQYNQIQFELNHYQQLTQSYNQLQEMYNIAQQEINNLQQELLVRKTAENNVQEIISTAEQTVSEEMVQKTTANLFKDPKPSESVFDDLAIESQILSTKSIEQDTSVSEFPPVNVDIFKDVVDKTTEPKTVTEEIIQPKTAYLCYPEPNKTKSHDETWGWGTEDKKIRESLESQIVSMEEMKISPEEKKIFQQWEYDPVAPLQGTSNQPIDEKIQDPKTAYLLYPEPNKTQSQDEAWGWGTDNQKNTLESQIVTMKEMKISPEEKKVFQQWEYGPVTSLQGASNQPVEEKIQEPKTAYLCYPEPKNVDTFASEEDGWGWNAEEAKLEAEHRQSLGPIETMNNGKIQQLKDQIHVLEVERDRLLEEVKTHQIRSGKLIKKLKQVKESYDKLVEKSKTDDFGLDMAIQDELNTQIKVLEKKVKETREENTKDKAEIENYKQRLDVLQAANERMIEIKEKTDNELQFLQFQNRELTSKLEQFEWGDDSPRKPVQEDDSPTKQSEDSNKKIQELNATIQDLTLDNEEMQLILEEQRRMRIEAEKALINNPIPEGMKPKEDFIKLENEISHLNELNRIAEENTSKLLLENEELKAKSNHLQLNIENLVQENNMMNHEAQLKVEQLQNEYIELQNQLQTISVENEYLKVQGLKQTELLQLREELLQVQQQKQYLESEYFEKQIIMEKIQSEIETVKNEQKTLQTELIEKEVCIQHLNNKIQELESEKCSLDERIQQFANIENDKDLCIQQLNNQIQQLLMEKSTLDQQIQEKQNLDIELNEKNICIQQLNSKIGQLETEKLSLDQRIQEGNEKLMASLQNLETKTEANMSSTIEEMAKIWSERVDQRGNDVAESWKLHLETVENEFSQKETKLKLELNEILTKNNEIIYQNNELQKQVDLLINEKQSFINDNNDIIQNLQQNLNTKQTEIYEISGQLQQLNTELEMKNNEIKTLKDASDLMKIKEIELEEAVTQLEEKIAECKTYEEQLEIKNDMIKDLEEKLNNLNVLSHDEQNQIMDLRNIIENQVLKIEELKGEIDEKNSEYNALVAEFDHFEQVYLKGEKPDPSLMENVDNFATEEQILNPSVDQTKVEIDNANAPVNRAELDLALYMLHQRDVRCEELTVELMQLLEERDTLQLKLSNAIRMNEDLRCRSSENLLKKDSPTPKVDKSTGAIPKSKAIVLGATGTELATEATETPGDLDKKLYELKTIGYRDKTLKDDQEFRHIQQMSLMQQHRDLAAKLPAEAAARLVDANYTLSRDVQSPSKVLLNWLWGRSTPKVNDV